MKRSKVKPGYLGPAFHEWLQHLEFVEAVIHDRKLKGKQVKRYNDGGYYFNDELFPATGLDTAEKHMEIRGRNGTLRMNETLYAMLPVDAWVAHLVRSSVKYRCPVDVLQACSDRYGLAWDEVFDDLEVRLPYDPVTIVFEGLGKPEDHVMVNITATTATDRSRLFPGASLEAFGAGVGAEVDYAALGIDEGEEFYNASICMYRDSGIEVVNEGVRSRQRLSHCPVEIHFNKGLPISETKWINAIAPGADVSPRGRHTMTQIQRCIVNWLGTFQLQGVLRSRRPGKSPALLVDEAKRRKPKHYSKFERPMFEHFVMEMEVDEPDPEQTGHTCVQPRKRQHQVRGHRRVYKSGKTVWVKPHWRGDKNLGVIKKDYEMTTHDPESSN